MAHTLKIDVERRIVLIKATGLYTREVMIALDDELRAHPDFDADFDELLDLGETDVSGITGEDIKSLTRRPPAFSPTSRRAFVIPPGDLAFGLVRMFEMMRESPDHQIELFTDIDEAKAWLGID